MYDVHYLNLYYYDAKYAFILHEYGFCIAYVAMPPGNASQHSQTIYKSTLEYEDGVVQLPLP